MFVFNNMITNNVAGLAGGGISIENSLRAIIRNNTIANNDSTATTALAGTSGQPGNETTAAAGGHRVPRPHAATSRLLMDEVLPTRTCRRTGRPSPTRC